MSDWRRYHDASVWTGDVVPARSESDWASVESVGWRKTYPRLPRYAIGLDDDDPTDVRRSFRHFDAETVDIETIASVVQGAVDVGHGTPYPSAGGLYAVECYVAARIVGGRRTLYHVLDRPASLEQLWACDNPTDIFPTQTWVLDASMLFFVTASMLSYTEKYGERGYRFALLEAGALAQSLDLSARAYGLTTCWVGGFADEHAAEFLDLRPSYREVALIAMAVGRRGSAPI